MLTIIAAMSENGCIGQRGALPWYLPEDLRRFKQLTTGHVVLMGRKTWESLPPKFRPLPNRANVVLSRQEKTSSVFSGAEVHGSIEGALAAHADEDIFVIGGAEVYAQALPHADVLHLTRVHRAVAGDAFFPPIDAAAWREAAREDHDGFSFVTYERAVVRVGSSAKSI